ncbi:hypothetical protein AOQ84DRAFT_23180 [Glonium stellatum]|uniref:Uncharacterized protein n=1 Tax=Glonium stellatum TaxID=574774 RepID=A0A8E2JTX5_9PEZI|nr:hypothetical protein AOQ84DRAFT_23180 [Glonium stellatum]
MNAIRQFFNFSHLEEASLYDGLFDEAPDGKYSLYNETHPGSYHRRRLKILNKFIKQVNFGDCMNVFVSRQSRDVPIGEVAIPDTNIMEGDLDLSLLWSLYGGTFRVMQWFKIKYCEMTESQLQARLDAYERQFIRYTRLGDNELIVALSARCMLLHSAVARVRAYGTRKSFDLTIPRPPWGSGLDPDYLSKFGGHWVAPQLDKGPVKFTDKDMKVNGRLVFSPSDFSDPETIEITPPTSRSPSPYAPNTRIDSDAAFPTDSYHSFVPPEICSQDNLEEPSTSSSSTSFSGRGFGENLPPEGRREFRLVHAPSFSQDQEISRETSLLLERKKSRRDGGFGGASFLVSIPSFCELASSKDGGVDIDIGHSPSPPSETEIARGVSLWGRKRGRTISDIGSTKSKRKSMESGGAGKMDEDFPEPVTEQTGTPMHWCSKVDVY